MLYFRVLHLLLNRWAQQLQTLQVHGSHDVEDTGQYSCDLDAKVKGQIMYFLVDLSPPKLLDTLQCFVYTQCQGQR